MPKYLNSDSRQEDRGVKCGIRKGKTSLTSDK